MNADSVYTTESSTIMQRIRSLGFLLLLTGLVAGLAPALYGADDELPAIAALPGSRPTRMMSKETLTKPLTVLELKRSR